MVFLTCNDTKSIDPQGGRSVSCAAITLPASAGSGWTPERVEGMLRYLTRLLVTEASAKSSEDMTKCPGRRRGVVPVVATLVCALSLGACAASRPVTSTLDAERLNLPPGAEAPPSALAMSRGLSLPEGVLQTVRPDGFDPTPTDRRDQNLLPGVYVADDQYDDTYMVDRRQDPILDAAMAELANAEPLPEEPPIELRIPVEAPVSLYAATVPIENDVAALPAEAGTFGIHITSYRESDSIRPGLAHILSRYGRELEGLRALINLEDVIGKGLFYRLKFGPFGSYEAALARCDRIKMQGEYCNVVSFNGQPL